MPVIGITGGIATGKSLVTDLFRQRGATTFSADEAARAMLAPGGPVLASIVQAFGPEIQRPDGNLDRAALGQRIFADPEARARLDRILHPPILRLLRAQIAAAQEDLPPEAVIAVEVPLLYEAHLEDWFDHIVVVSASETTQLTRLRIRNGLEEAEARQRLAAQWPLADKVARADFVLTNDGSRDEIAAAVAALWKRLRTAPCRRRK
jgi:dephospho-CoA kinase